MSVPLAESQPRSALVMVLAFACLCALQFLTACGDATPDTKPVVVVPPTLEIITGTLPTGSVGKGYLAQIRVEGGTPPYTYSIVGQVPPGLVINQAGNIGGVPNTINSFTFGVQIDDSGEDAFFQSTSKQFTINVVAGTDLPLIGTALLPDAVLNSAYFFQLQAGGGTLPYTWSAQGNLPSGVTLNPQGVLAGNPTIAGTFVFTAVVMDNFSLVGSKDLTLEVLAVAPSNAKPDKPEIVAGDSLPFIVKSGGPVFERVDHLWGVSCRVDFSGKAPPDALRLHSGNFEWAQAGGLNGAQWLIDRWMMVQELRVEGEFIVIDLRPWQQLPPSLEITIQCGAEVFTFLLEGPSHRG